MPESIWIGFDSKQVEAYAVARHSAKRLGILPIPVYPLVLKNLINEGFYKRPIETKDGKLWDPRSEAYMSTEFSNSRFLVPKLARSAIAPNGNNWALFVDCDVLFRVDPLTLFRHADPQYAVMCVKHDYRPKEATKMDGQVQTVYPRKNWSSVMLINCGHPSNRPLWDPAEDIANNWTGKDLHRFSWLKDNEIGELPIDFNYLVNYHSNEDSAEPAIVHFTEGIPTMSGYESCEYSHEWFDELNSWISNGT